MRIKDFTNSHIDLENGQFIGSSVETEAGFSEFHKGNPLKKIVKEVSRPFKKVAKEVKRAYEDVEDVVTGKETNAESAAKREAAAAQAAADSAAAANAEGARMDDEYNPDDEKKKKKTKTKKASLKVPLATQTSTGLKV